MKYLILIIIAINYCTSKAEPLVIDVSTNDLIVFKSNGVTIGKLVMKQTAGDNKVLQFVTKTNVPIMQLGSDRDASDVQISPSPIDKPRFHFQVTGNGSGGHGDMRIDGTMTIGTDRALCSDITNDSTCLPVDPRGAIRISRERPVNESMAQVIISRRNNSNNLIEESLRIGTNADGFPFLGINSTGDQSNLYFRKGPDWLMMALCGDNGKCGRLTKDNSKALKYENEVGYVTQLAQ